MDGRDQHQEKWLGINIEQNKTNILQNVTQQQFFNAGPEYHSTIPPGQRLPCASTMGHLPQPRSFTNLQVDDPRLPLLECAPQLNLFSFPLSPHVPLDSPEPTRPSPSPPYSNIPNNVNMKSGAYYQDRWAPPRTLDIIEYEPHAILSTAAEAHQQPLQATQAQAMEDHRRTLISQQRPQMRLAHGQKQQHTAHESQPTTDQNVRTAVQSYPSSPSNGMQQTAAPYMPIANMGTGNAMSPALHRTPYGIGQTPWATANSPLVTVSNAPQATSIMRTPTANMYTAGQVAAQITAQSGQPAAFPSAQIHPVPAVLPPRSVFDSRQQQVTSRTTFPTINSTSHMPTLSRQTPPQPSQSTQGRKRRANEPPEGTAQAQKRQATAASNPPLHTGRYRTPDIMQRLSTAMAASNGETEVASPVSNSQAQLTREQQAYKNELFESHRLAEEQRLERQRWLARKEELRKDPSALFRHYHEYIEYFPLGYGEYKSQYHSRLLANQRMPFEPESELGVAITYAKEHWDVYMEYSKDVTRATEVARKKAQKQEHDARQQWMNKTKSGRAVR